MTEIKGDLISREWLKDAFDNLCCHNCKICRNFRNEDSFYKCSLIENATTVERPHGTCKTCKHYTPYREQFSYRYRGDGYCKSTITTSEGKAYINCHDEWYCANYEKGGDEK